MTSSSPVLQTIYNAITNGTPCVIVEGSGRVADVIAQVANLPNSKITINLIQKKLSIFFYDSYEQFTESKIMEWTKKVRLKNTPCANVGMSQCFLGKVFSRVKDMLLENLFLTLLITFQ